MIPFGTLGDGQSLGAAPLPGQYLPIGQELQTATLCGENCALPIDCQG